MEEGQMKVEYLRPDELVPYPGNAKQHPADQIKHIANSIKRFGWQQPIVCDKDRVVIIGHGRLLAAKELLLDSVPVVFAEDLTEEEANALRLADNKLNESPWDFSKLEEELAALDIAGIDMEQFGFMETAMDFPENLDADEDQDHKIHVKLTFQDYESFAPYEDELKETAERIGAEYGLAKS
jgi:hypothetical protein